MIRDRVKPHEPFRATGIRQPEGNDRVQPTRTHHRRVERPGLVRGTEEHQGPAGLAVKSLQLLQNLRH